LRCLRPGSEGVLGAVDSPANSFPTSFWRIPSSASAASQICLARRSSSSNSLSSLRSSAIVCLITVLALFRRAERSAFRTSGTDASVAPSRGFVGVSKRTLPLSFDFGVSWADCGSTAPTKEPGFFPLPRGLPRGRFEGVSGAFIAEVGVPRSLPFTKSACPNLVLFCLGEPSFSFSPSSSCRFLFDVITGQPLA